MGTRPATELLLQHVERFNHGVRSGDFGPMIASFTEDAVVEFEGIARTALVGRSSIADAYGKHPPDDEVDLIETVERPDGTAVASYAWKSEAASLAGEMRLVPNGRRIARLTITFGSHSPDVTPS